MSKSHPPGSDKSDGPTHPLVAYRWVGALIVLGLGITLMIQAL